MELRLTWAYDAFGKTMYFEAKNKKKVYKKNTKIQNILNYEIMLTISGYSLAGSHPSLC